MALEDLILNIPGVAIEFEHRLHEGRDLWRAVSRKAEEFLDFGLRPRDAVVLHLELSDEYILSLLAMLSLDLVVVPVDVSTPSPFLEESAAQSGAVARVSRSRLERIEIRERAPGNPALAQAQYVLFTSGSTGRPKGVIGSREGLVNRIAWGRDQFFNGSARNCCIRVNPSFVDSLTEILCAVAAGRRLLVAPPGAQRDTGSLVRFVSESQAELVTSTPSAIPVIAQLSGLWPLGHVRHWIFSGEELRRDWVTKVREFSPAAEIVNSYGSTEVSGDVAFFRLSPATPVPSRIPIGTGVPGVELRIVADDGTTDAARGELLVGGAQVALGYVGDPDESGSAFWTEVTPGSPDVRWFRTNDLVETMGEDLVYVGRRGDTDKVRGRRVDLGGVAHRLEALPRVIEAAAWIEEGQEGLRTLAAAVALAADDQPSPSQLLAILSESVPPHMVPDRLVAVDRLPRTKSGKVDRRLLMRHGAPRRSPREQDFATGIEYAIALAIAGILQTGEFDSRTRLREIGLDSLRSVLAAERISQMLNCSIDGLTVLTSDSVEEIAHEVIRRQGESSAGAVRGVRSGTGTEILFAHPAIGTGIGYFPLVSRLPESWPVAFLEQDAAATDRLNGGGMAELARHYAELVAERLQTRSVHLVGHSFGAVLLPALGLELERLGIEIAVAVLLDPAIPTSAPAASLDWALRRILSDSGYRMSLPLEAMSEADALGLIHEHPGPLARVSLDQLSHWARVLTTNARSLYGYAPPPWEHEALVVLARKRDSVTGDTRWARIALPHATMTTIECSHFELIRPPFVDSVAKLITAAVNRRTQGGTLPRQKRGATA